MLIWCITLFFLGILAFLDSIFNYGEIFRRVNSIVFMLLSLGLLFRTSMMMKMKNKEKLIQRNNELEQELKQKKQPAEPSKNLQEATAG